MAKQYPEEVPLWAAVQPVGRLHFAGADFSPLWPGYMDGAIRSGERAAHEALERLSRGG